MLDDLRSYLQMASGLTEATTAKAKEVVANLLSQGMSLSAIPEERPAYLGADLRVLLSPYPTVDVRPDEVRCGRALARRTGERLDVTVGTDPWDAVRAAAALAWTSTDVGRPLDCDDALARLAAALG